MSDKSEFELPDDKKPDTSFISYEEWKAMLEFKKEMFHRYFGKFTEGNCKQCKTGKYSKK